MPERWRACVVTLVWTVLMACGRPATGGDFEIVTSSYFGAAGFDDSIVGARIQADGTIVLAANLGPGVKVTGLSVEVGKNGCIVRLSPESASTPAGATTRAAPSCS
jgi:hypothetical protein